MAQGGGKLAKKKINKKSEGSQKRKQLAAKKHAVQKGRKFQKPKGRKAGFAREQQETTKAINRKNEALASARAVGAGDRFFLSDIRESGKKELAEQNRQRNKKESKTNNVSDRLKDQLRKLGKEV